MITSAPASIAVRTDRAYRIYLDLDPAGPTARARLTGKRDIAVDGPR